MRKQRLSGLAAAFLSAVLLSACGGGGSIGGDDGDGDGNGGGGNSTDGISLVLGASEIAPGGTVLLRATVTGTGTGISNKNVSFSASAGSVSQSVVRSNVSGVAESFLTAPTQAGQVTVTASVAGFSATQTLTVGVGSVETVEVNALPANIPLGGTSQIQVFVTDANGNAIPNVGLQFRVTANTTGGQLESLSGATDDGGMATVSYTAGGSSGSDNIRVTATGGRFGSATVTSSAANAVIGAVTLTLGRSSVEAGGNGTTATARVTDDSGAPVRGVQVGFSATAGSITNVVTTDSTGRAVAQYLPPVNPGSFIIRAAVGVVDSEQPVTVTRGPSSVSSVTLISSSPSLRSSASTAAQGVTLTALVRDQNNNVLEGVGVNFVARRNASSSCGAGGALQVVNGTTSTAGEATAVLTTGGDTTNQIIDVIATAGGVSAGLTIAETGTTININGPSSTGLGSTQSYTISLRDAANNPISGKTLAVTSSSGNTISSSSFTTDANGQITVSYTGTVGGGDTLTVQPQNCVSSAMQATKAIQVAAQTLTILAPTDNAQIPFGNDLSLGVEVVNGGSGYAVDDVLTVNGGTFTTRASLVVTAVNAGAIRSVNVVNAGSYTALPPSPATAAGGSGTGAQFAVFTNITARLTGGTVVGQTISFNTTRGSLSATTDTTEASGAAGVASVRLTQSSGVGNAGGSVITATCTTCSPQISASTSFSFNATTPARIDLQPLPALVGIGGSSIVTATVLDTNDNLVANQLVTFTMTDDSGGSLEQSSAVTGSDGKAQVTYRAGNTTSSANGVKVTARIGGISGTTSMTVGGQSLRIVLGTGNEMEEDGPTRYKYPYTVLVTDAAGTPPPAGSIVNLSIHALSYQKGTSIFVDPVWSRVYSVDCSSDPGCASTQSFGCFNEDADLDGRADPGENFNNNFINGDPLRPLLDPGAPVSVPASVALDAKGIASFDLTYPQDRAYWVQVRLSATVSVNGSQGATFTDFILEGLADDFNQEDVSPPGFFSPYGRASLCSNPN